MPSHHHLHELFLWFWFFIGAFAYMAKRGYYLVKGPNPVASNWKDFFKVASVPLGFRFLVDSGVYWACFTPEILENFLLWVGWQKFAYVISVVTQFAVCALFFGLGVDPMIDWGIGSVVSKVPFLKDWWPQMPPPLVPPVLGGK